MSDVSASYDSTWSLSTRPAEILPPPRKHIEINHITCGELETWLEQFAHSDVLKRVLAILVDDLGKVPHSAAMLVVAPEVELRSLELNTVDEGKLISELQDVTVHMQQFQHRLVQFAKPHAGDRDEHGRPTDGGFAISHRSGKILAAAVRFMAPPSEFSVRNHGTRHAAGADVAAMLQAGFVFVRSESGSVTLFPSEEVRAGRAFQIPAPGHQVSMRSRDVGHEPLHYGHQDPETNEDLDRYTRSVRQDAQKAVEAAAGLVKKGDSRGAAELLIRASLPLDLLISVGVDDEFAAALCEPDALNALVEGTLRDSTSYRCQPEAYYTSVALRELLDLALERVEQSNSKSKAHVAGTLHNVGVAHMQLGAAEVAEPLLTRSLSMRQDQSNADYNLLAQNMNDLGRSMLDQGKPHEALHMLQKALSIWESQTCRDELKVALALNNIGDAHMQLGHQWQAKSFFLCALDIRKRVREHETEVARTLSNLGRVHIDMGEPDLALQYLTEALTIREKEFGTDHVAVAWTLNNIGDAHLELGDFDAARPVLLHALDIRERHLGPSHPEVARTLSNLGRAHVDTDAAEKAQPLLERALNIRKACLGRNHVAVARTSFQLGRAYLDLRLPLQARPLLENAFRIFVKEFGQRHIAVAKVKNSLVRALVDTGSSPSKLRSFLKHGPQMLPCELKRTQSGSTELSFLSGSGSPSTGSGSPSSPAQV